jgi:hypothetical protein
MVVVGTCLPMRTGRDTFSGVLGHLVYLGRDNTAGVLGHLLCMYLERDTTAG